MGSVRSQGPGWSFRLGSGKLEPESSGCSLAEPEAGGLEGGDQPGCLGFRLCSPGLWLCSGPRLLTGKGARLSCWGTRASRNGGAGGKEGVLRCGVSPHSSRDSRWWQWRTICLLTVSAWHAEATGRGWWRSGAGGVQGPNTAPRVRGFLSKEVSGR